MKRIKDTRDALHRLLTHNFPIVYNVEKNNNNDVWWEKYTVIMCIYVAITLSYYYASRGYHHP